MAESNIIQTEYIKNYYDSIKNKYPIIKKNVRIHQWPNMYIIYGEISDKDKKTLVSGSSMVIVNISGIKVLDLCNGINTTKEIVKYLSEEAKLAEEDTSLKVTNFLLRFHEYLHHIEFSNTVVEERKLFFTGSKNYFAPVHVVLEITDDCNLKCKHCYRLEEKYNATYMEFGDAIQIIDKIYQLGARTLELTGGEFTMHPRYLDIIDYAYNKMDLIGLLTNGISLNDKVIEKLNKYKDKLLFSVSFDSYNPEQYSKFRGVNRTVHKRLCDNIKKLTGSGHMVRITMTYTNETINEIKDTIDFAKNELNALQFSFSPHLPLGRASELKFKYSFEEMNSKMEDIREYSKKYENFISFLPENYHNQMNNKNFLHNCGLGWKTMTIGPDGKVRPCVMCNDGVFNWGNVITDSFENILKNPLVETLSKANLPNSKTCERCQCKLFCMYCIYRAVIINVDRINKGLGYCEWARENIDIFDYINNNAVMSKCINKQIDSLLG